MKVVGILGVLLLVFGLLVSVIGVGGAVANFFFAPESPNCRLAEEDFKKAQKLMVEYEAAKGTPEELAKRVELEQTINGAKSSQEYCNRAKDSHRFYGMVFSGIGVIGIIMTLIGAIAAFVGLRKSKSLA